MIWWEVLITFGVALAAGILAVYIIDRLQLVRAEKRSFETLRAVYQKHTKPDGQRWYEVAEVMPERDTFYMAYSSVFRCYYIAKFWHEVGWMGVDESRIAHISHFLDVELFFPFEATNRVDEDLARDKGLL